MLPLPSVGVSSIGHLGKQKITASSEFTSQLNSRGGRQLRRIAVPDNLSPRTLEHGCQTAVAFGRT